jgi:hypothetical protein
MSEGGIFNDVVFCRWIRRNIRAFDDSRFGVVCEVFGMSALLAVLAAVPAVEAVKMLSCGATLAVAVYTAAKTGRRRR